MPAVDAIGADLVHQYRLAYVTTYPVLTATRLRVAVAGTGTTATAGATVRVPPVRRVRSTCASVRGLPGHAGVSVAWLIAAALLLGLAGVAIVECGGYGASPAARDEPENRQRVIEFQRSGNQRRVDNDVVDIAVAGIVEVAPARDEAQLTVERGEIHRLGRELVLGVPLESLHAEDQHPAVGQADPDGISRPQICSW